MTDLGKFLIIAGLVLVVGGFVLVGLGRANFPLGRLPGDIVYRGKKHDVLFSFSDFAAGERGAFDCVVCGGEMEAMRVAPHISRLCCRPSMRAAICLVLR